MMDGGARWRIFFVFAAVGLLATAAEAKVWRYVDKHGGVHYTSDINALPAKTRARILERRRHRPDAAPAPPPVRAAGDAGVAPPSGQRIIFPEGTHGDQRLPAKPPPKAAGMDDETRRIRWQTLLRDTRARVADARHRFEIAELAANKANRDALLVPTGVAYEKRRLAQEELAKAQGALDEAKAAEKALLERADREDVPPGWLR